MSTKLDIGIVYPLWNHVRGGESLLERVIGEVGIDHVTIPLVTGEVEQFRPHHFPEEPYFHTEGGWHYRPDAKLYAASGTKPHTAKWLGSRNPLGEVIEIARATNVRVNIEINLAQLGHALEQLPQLRQVTAWGQVHHSASACPSNPLFRELAEAILRDVAKHEPDGLWLHVPGGVYSAAGLPILARALTSMVSRYCFCASCRQLAASKGVNVDEIAARMRQISSAKIESDNAYTARIDFEDKSFGPEYRNLREDDVRSWLNSVRAARNPDTVWFVTPGNLWQDFTCDGFRRLHLTAGAWFAVRDENAKISAALLGIQLQSPPSHRPSSESGESADVVRWFQMAVEAGIDHFDITGLEQAPPDRITWLKQAVRYVRRS